MGLMLKSVEDDRVRGATARWTSEWGTTVGMKMGRGPGFLI